MPQQPTGTVTFLFTDIEGSTKLAREHPQSWDAAQRRHHEMLREAIESDNGYVFQVIGDAFCAAFHKAGDAVRAAYRAQQRLQEVNWGETPIRVRMGIHTGEAEAVGPDYRGYLTLSLVQRLMSAGHGGQVLVSGAAENLLRGQLPKEVSLRDLGKHTFRDVPAPVRVFQVVALGLPVEFPPLRTAPSHPNNLPTQLTSFVGREKELADIQKLLADTHILTLIGPGGTGKTRLSIQVASALLDRYPDGLWLVEFAPILDPVLVPRVTAMTMGLRDEPQRPVIDMLCEYLRDKQMLLILDNCEHLVDACARMADRVLHAAPDVRILASSREALGIGGEVTYRIPSLGLPDLLHPPSIESLSQYEAVKLFIDRAKAAIPTFSVTNENAPAVAQICHRLDGIPLAIELAAAKIRVLKVDQIAKRLDDRFRLLTGGSRTAMERHQTLRAAIDWSYNLLPTPEQTLFRRLSIFVGGWTLEGAESVCADEKVKSEDILTLLEQLINKSLVSMDETQAEPRYSMLETIRQYANEKLVEAGESDALRDRHLTYFLNVAETAEPYLVRPEQLEWLARLEADYQNLRLALEWSLSHQSSEPSLRLSNALGRFWVLHQSYCSEGAAWLASALAKSPQNNGDHLWRVRALGRDAEVAEMLDDLARLKVSAELGFTLAQEGSDPRDLAIARFFFGWVFFRHAEWDQARPYFEQSVKEFQELQDPYWTAFAYRWLQGLMANQGDPYLLEHAQHSLMLARKAGERANLARALVIYGEILFGEQRSEESKACLAEAAKVANELGPNSMLSTLVRMRRAGLAWFYGDRQQAKSLFGDALARLRLLGEKYTYVGCNLELGLLYMEEGAFDQAKEYIEEALSTARELDIQYQIARCLTWRGLLFYFQGDIPKSRNSLKESVSIVRELNIFFTYDLLESLFTFPYFQTSPHSVKLLGAVRTFQAKTYALKNRWLERDAEYAETQLRILLGDDAFETSFAAGQQLSLEEALNLAQQMIEAM